MDDQVIKRIPSHVWGRCKIIQEQPKNGYSTPISTVQFLQGFVLGIDGEPIVFEWIFPLLDIFQKTQKNLQDQNIEPQHFEERIIFVSMSNDIDWTI